jgi:hypothetical protein
MGGLHPENFLVQLRLLASRFVQPGIKVGQFLFAFRPQLDVERLARQALLVGIIDTTSAALIFG